MKRNNLDFVKGLLAISENDWKIASAGMKEDLPLDGICFHIQQTAEKLLKALLAEMVKRLREMIRDFLPPEARP